MKHPSPSSTSRRGRRSMLTKPLRDLARLFGIHTAYDDFFGWRREASREVVLRAARLLGAEIETADDAPDAVRAKTLEVWRQLVEPVVVAVPGRANTVEVRVPERDAASGIRCVLREEDGPERTWVAKVSRVAIRAKQIIDGTRYLRARTALPADLPPGYHDLAVECGGRTARAVVISAPVRAMTSDRHTWGVFLPLYALHSERSWGVGDFTDLGRLQAWVGQLGGEIVSILPILAAYLDDPFEPSPYAPVSRLFWNEFYVDPRQAPELSVSRDAQQLLASPDFERDIASFRSASHVDYRRQMVLRRRVLSLLADTLEHIPSGRSEALGRYAEAHPSLHDYAAFRATTEASGCTWPGWPARPRDGTIEPSAYSRDAYRYHRHAQWLASEQLETAATGDHQRGLYLDFPLGVHADGYDTWRYRDLFVREAAGGAPPDAVFTQGQNWGFPPLHPEAIRRQGYRYIIDCLRHQLGPATVLRIDHVMGLHRLYWVPAGFPASDGVYVEYRSREWYAVLSLESHRQRASIVGENLGTVPREVDAALARHAIRRMYVVQYEAQPRSRRPLRSAEADEIASLNTHDMPTFAAYARGLDFVDRRDLGLLPPKQARPERESRRRVRTALSALVHREGLARVVPRDVKGLTRAMLLWLAGSRASVVLVNLEDLWQEEDPQNVPGTGLERRNWMRRSRRSLEQFSADPNVVRLLQLIAANRDMPDRHSARTKVGRFSRGV